MFFASLTLVELAPILGIFAGMLVAFYALVKFLIGEASKTSDADRVERKELASAFNRVAEATERSAREAETRNGHLAEISIQNKESIIEAVHRLTIARQTVKQQTVQHETVLSKDK